MAPKSPALRPVVSDAQRAADSAAIRNADLGPSAMERATAQADKYGPSFLRTAQRVTLGRTGHFADVDVNRLSPEVLAHVFAYGLKQVLNDAAASGKTDDEKTGLFNKKLEALYAGTLRAQRQGLSPLERHCIDIATTRGKSLGHSGDKLKAFVAKAKDHDAIVHLAKKRLAEAELDLDIDLGD